MLQQSARQTFLIISVRRRAFSDQVMQSIRSHITHKKPILGIRTSSHAFELRNDSPPEGHQDWPAWDQEVIGGNYQGHHGKEKTCLIRRIQFAMQPLLLKQVRLPFRTRLLSIEILHSRSIQSLFWKASYLASPRSLWLGPM